MITSSGNYAAIKNAAHGCWGNEILPYFGIDKHFLSGKHSPCPIHGGKDGFRFTDEGRGFWVCATCTDSKFLDGFNLIEKHRGISNREAFRMVADYIRNNSSSIHVQKMLTKKETSGISPVKTQTQRQEIGALYAKAILSQCIRRTHPYLQTKGLTQLVLINTKSYPVPDSAQIVRAGALIIPLYDLETGRLVSLQFINADKTRGYIANSSIANAVHTVSGALSLSLDWIGVTEGFANALVASIVTGADIVMACDASSLVSKCQRIAASHPEKRIVFFCDNDKDGKGQKAGFKASNLTGGVTITPPGVGQDWSDYFLKYGLEQTRITISNQLIIKEL